MTARVLRPMIFRMKIIARLALVPLLLAALAAQAGTVQLTVLNAEGRFALGDEAQTRSTTSAMPCPTPMHMVHSA